MKIVEDERGHVYRVLETEPTLTKSALTRVQPLSRRRDGWHDHGESRIVHSKLLKEHGEEVMAKEKQAKKKASVKAPKTKAAKEPKAKAEPTPAELLPAGFSGHVARVEGTKVIGVHKAKDGESLCGSDVTTISPNLAAHKGFWKSVKDAVTCGRCLKAEAKAEAKPKEKAPKAASKAKVVKAPAAKKGAAAKATSKSAAARSRNR